MMSLTYAMMLLVQAHKELLKISTETDDKEAYEEKASKLCATVLDKIQKEQYGE